MGESQLVNELRERWGELQNKRSAFGLQVEQLKRQREAIVAAIPVDPMRAATQLATIDAQLAAAGEVKNVLDRCVEDARKAMSTRNDWERSWAGRLNSATRRGDAAEVKRLLT